MSLPLLLTQEHGSYLCVPYPASTSRLVVANVAELGKQEKREETRLETPCQELLKGCGEMKRRDTEGVLEWEHSRGSLSPE